MNNRDSHSQTRAFSAWLTVFRRRSTVYRWELLQSNRLLCCFAKGAADFDLKRRQTDLLSRLSERQGSSVAEQGTHKPLVGSSNLPPGMGSSGIERHRAGSSEIERDRAGPSGIDPGRGILAYSNKSCFLLRLERLCRQKEV